MGPNGSPASARPIVAKLSCTIRLVQAFPVCLFIQLKKGIIAMPTPKSVSRASAKSIRALALVPIPPLVSAMFPMSPMYSPKPAGTSPLGKLPSSNAYEGSGARSESRNPVSGTSGKLPMSTRPISMAAGDCNSELMEVPFDSVTLLVPV